MAPINALRGKTDPVTRTYRYLRIALIGTVIVIFAAVGAEWAQHVSLGSISAYYYTGARTPFVGALFAAAITLIALAGNGLGRILLSIAAMFAPIIALVPTPLKHGAIPGLADGCGTGSCVPTHYLADVTTGVWTYLILGLMAIVLLIVLAAIHSNAWGPTLLLAGILAVVLFFVWFGWTLERSVFLGWAHYVSAGLFFLLIGVVAIFNAAAPTSDYNANGYVQSFRIGPPRAWARAAYIGVAIGEGLNVVIFVFVFLQKLPILPDEAVALALFAIFWLFQTIETISFRNAPRTIDPGYAGTSGNPPDA
jgi:hypothetical protein